MGCRRVRAALAVGTLALGASACSTGGEPGGITADAYVAALGEFLPTAPDDDGDPPVVYVVPIGDEALDLDTQVAVIDAFAECCDVRFVDDPQAAIDDGQVDAAPREASHLLGIGTIHATLPYTVRVEQYTDATSSQAHLVTLTKRPDAWRVESVVEVEPEVLVGDG